MDTSALATEIAAKVTADTSLWVAIVGLIGVIAGAVIAVVGSIVFIGSKTDRADGWRTAGRSCCCRCSATGAFRTDGANYRRCLEWSGPTKTARSDY
jgi:hypothetical protein